MPDYSPIKNPPVPRWITPGGGSIPPSWREPGTRRTPQPRMPRPDGTVPGTPAPVNPPGRFPIPSSPRDPRPDGDAK